MSQTNLTQGIHFTAESNLFLEYLTRLTQYAILANLIVFSQPVCVFGITSNIVNILVFVRQGFQDGVNITLTVLAVSDIGALMAFQAYIINYNPLIELKNLVYRKTLFGFFALSVHQYFIKTSAMITALASLERCVSVTMPLSVKLIFTRRVIVITNVSILLCPLIFVYPTIQTVNIDWMFLPEMNKTFLTLVFTNASYSVVTTQQFISNMFLPYLNFSTLIICSTIIFIRMRTRSHWRKSITQSDVNKYDGHKERKMTKLLMIVSLVCLALLLPQCLVLSVLGGHMELYFGSSIQKIGTFITCFTLPLQAINCSVNIVIYYKMSTRFRSHLHDLLTCLKSNKHIPHCSLKLTNKLYW
ncbi:FMRFamide receptor [Biomphalaria glabrata]|nr:FMRFamide receptor-like [Biomphalaria glabrata]